MVQFHYAQECNLCIWRGGLGEGFTIKNAYGHGFFVTFGVEIGRWWGDIDCGLCCSIHKLLHHMVFVWMLENWGKRRESVNTNTSNFVIITISKYYKQNLGVNKEYKYISIKSREKRSVQASVNQSKVSPSYSSNPKLKENYISYN